MTDFRGNDSARRWVWVGRKWQILDKWRSFLWRRQDFLGVVHSIRMRLLHEWPSLSKRDWVQHSTKQPHRKVPFNERIIFPKCWIIDSLVGCITSYTWFSMYYDGCVHVLMKLNVPLIQQKKKRRWWKDIRMSFCSWSSCTENASNDEVRKITHSNMQGV